MTEIDALFTGPHQPARNRQGRPVEVAIGGTDLGRLPGPRRGPLQSGWRLGRPRVCFNDAITSPAFDRSAANGIRLVAYPDTTNIALAGASIEKEFRDYRASPCPRSC